MTAICPTRNRPQWIQQAVQCFERQRYQNAEMLIVADGEDIQCRVTESLPDGAPHRHRIRYVYLGPDKFTIGTKRNLACQLARGSVIVHFDDDDYSAPGRIQDQIMQVERIGACVVGYHRMIFRDESGARFQFDGSTWNVCGTSLAYRKSWWQAHRFPPVSLQEEVPFIQSAIAERCLHSADAHSFMEASIHSDNTSPRNLELEMFRRL